MGPFAFPPQHGLPQHQPAATPLPQPHPPPRKLHHVYVRFMSNPTVARWLLTRNSGTDFLSVRPEDSFLVNLSSASQPEVLPPSTPHVSFSNLHDLLFLDHVSDDYGLGYVWGKPGSDAHPFAQLPQRLSMSGWDKLRCRRFAANLRPGSMLERVEFAWFENHRLIVTIVQSPAQPGAQYLSACESYFFPALQPNSTPRGSPLITAHMSDVPLCDLCKLNPRGHCKCNRDTDSLLFPISLPVPSIPSASRFPPSPLQTTPWKRYVQLLQQSKDSGKLSTALSVPNEKGEPVVRIHITRAYSISFGNPEAINEGIHLRLKQMLLSRPAPPTPLDMPLTRVDWKQTWPNTRQDIEECLDPIGNRATGRKPVETGQLCDGPDEISTCSPPIPGSTAWLQDPLPSPDSVVPISDSTDRRDRFKDRDLSSPPQLAITNDAYPAFSTNAAGSTESIPSLHVTNAKSTAQKKRKAHESGLCGQGKMGKDGDCSAETMPNQFLSTILNSSKDIAPSLLANFAEMSSISPLFPNMPTPGSVTGDASSPVTADRLSCTKENGQREAQLGHGLQSTHVKAANCVLPSPISMILDFSEESAKKKSRMDAGKDDLLPLCFDTPWDADAVEESEKFRRLREPFSWAPTAIPERPISALGRALGMERAPSPFGIAKPFQLKSPIDIHRGQEEKNKWLQLLPTNRRIEPLRVEKTQSPQDAKSMRPGRLLLKLPDEVVKANQEGTANSLRRFTSAERNMRRQAPKLEAHEKSNSTAGGSDRALPRTGEKKSTSVQCEICQATFSKRANLVRHTKTVHNNVKPFGCVTCGSRFGLKADLHRHVRNIHEKRAFCCRACGRSYAEQDELDFHYRVTHEKDLRPFECGQCGMRFGRRSSRRRHEQTVHTEKRFDCSMCDKSYSQRFDAIKHGRKAHGVERVVN